MSGAINAINMHNRDVGFIGIELGFNDPHAGMFIGLRFDVTKPMYESALILFFIEDK
jgi:hypothetical protein